MPGTVDEIIRVAEQTEACTWTQLITALQSDRQAVADALARILRTAADTDPGQNPAGMIYGASRDKIRSITSAPVVMTGRSSCR